MGPVFILNLHGIGTPKREVPPSEQRVWIELEQFKAILDYTKARQDIQLTFDDANESDYSVALPELQARGLKAQFFIVAERVDRPAYLSRNQLGELLEAGMEIGSHGMRHRRWVGLSREELREELVEARDQLEQLSGRKINRVSCPFGSYNRNVIGAIRKTGYTHMYSSDGGAAQAEAFILPRNSVYRNWKVAHVAAIVCGKSNGARRIGRNVKLLLKRWR